MAKDITIDSEISLKCHVAADDVERLGWGGGVAIENVSAIRLMQ